MNANDNDPIGSASEAAAEQVRAVRWKLLRSVHTTNRDLRAALYEWHREWVHQLQQRHPSWPLNEILEMLLLTEGSAAEVDREYAAMKAQTNCLWPGNLRDYQQFLSVLHAKHQHRIAAGHRDESRQDRQRRLAAEKNEVWRRTGKLPGLPKP